MSSQRGKFERLGVTQTGDVLQFAVRVSEDVPVSLLLYRKGRNEAEREIPFLKKEAIGDVRLLCVSEVDPRDYEYNFRIDGKVVQDPCAQVLRGEKQFGVEVENSDGHQVRCGFDTEEYDWEGDRKPQIP